MSEQPGRDRLIAGRYRLLSPLGEGGMGTVWRAHDEVLRREVAVKEVRAPAGLPVGDVERMYALLEREAWAAARVAHPNVVTVYDVAMEGGRPWIVMELVRGRSLADILETTGPLSVTETARVGAEVLDALRAAHDVGVLHRDVKPANVLLSDDGRVVLTDFGIASVEGSSALTMAGEVIGSPEFLSPERALGRTPGPESDLWSLGVLLYAAVEGGSPFRHDTPLSTLRAVVDEPLPPPHLAGPLTPVIEGLLRKDPEDRLPAEQAARELRLIAAGGAPTTRVAYVPPPAPTVPLPEGEPDPAPPVRERRAGVVLFIGALALVLALAGLTYTLLNRDDGDRNEGGSTPSATVTKTDEPRSPTPASHEPSPSTSKSSAPPSSREPAQSVRVSLTGTHTRYEGSCPPPEAESPVFTATFTVGRLPAEVRYRWKLKHGSFEGEEWRTLSLPEGGERTRQARVTVRTNDEDGTSENAIRVEVREPARVTSDEVPFTVTCDKTTETPSDGVSASSSGTP
ncbi:serine/threonine-protein kinase [Streptomyces sp. NRRL F-2799]|uniref:serine/threonine-protein kinase n=1 Tax=Streptomyces sp. NRRL F-2799 TaxID=1463844 RepID=UPI0004C84CD8|nr:serine/threonine-protein kinase [Streptomyces sp. NRRL F-2799]